MECKATVASPYGLVICGKTAVATIQYTANIKHGHPEKFTTFFCKTHLECAISWGEVEVINDIRVEQ